MHNKKVYKKTIRVDGRIKAIIEQNFRDVSRRTGLRLSYGKIARAFWSSLATDKNLRERCMKAACRAIIAEYKEKQNNGHGRRGRF